MNPRGIESAIYATAYSVRLSALIEAGYPHAWRVADVDAGRPPGDGERIAEWESWCAALAVDHAEYAVKAHRRARRRR